MERNVKRRRLRRYQPPHTDQQLRSDVDPPPPPWECGTRRSCYFPPLLSSSPSPPPPPQQILSDCSSMDFDRAYYSLTEPRKEKENMPVVSHSKEAYRKLLDDSLLSNRSRILFFKNKPPAPSEGMFNEFSSNVTSATQTKPARQQRDLRELREINEDDYIVSIRSHETLRQLIASKKNGTHIQLSHDKKIVIKIISKNDMKVLLHILPNYHRHLQTHKNTILPNFLGLYIVKPLGGQKVEIWL